MVSEVWLHDALASLHAPIGALSSKKTTFVYLTNVVFFVELLAGLEPAAC